MEGKRDEKNKQKTKEAIHSETYISYCAQMTPLCVICVDITERCSIDDSAQ